MSPAVVRPAADANAVAADQKIERAVAGDIREDNATANHVGDVNAGFGGDVGETPIAQIAIELEAILKADQDQVGTAIAIEISRGDARTVVEGAVRRAHFSGERVGDGNTGRCGADEGKTGFAS